MNTKYNPLINNDLRCASNSAYQALKATYLNNIFNLLNQDETTEFIGHIAQHSHLEALYAIENILNYWNIQYMHFIDKSELNRNNIKNKKIFYNITSENSKIYHDFEIDGYFFELTSAIYFKNNGFHYVALVKQPNNNVEICNDLSVKSPKIENPNIDFYNFPNHLIESGNDYICVGCIYQKINDDQV